MICAFGRNITGCKTWGSQIQSFVGFHNSFSKFHDEGYKVMHWVCHFAFSYSLLIPPTIFVLPDEIKYCWYYSYSLWEKVEWWKAKWENIHLPGSDPWDRNYRCRVDWMLCFAHSCSSSRFFHLSKYHFHPPSCLGQSPRSHACFSLLFLIQDTSKMYLEFIFQNVSGMHLFFFISPNPNHRQSHQNCCGSHRSSYICSCSLMIHSPGSSQWKSASATCLLEILHWFHISI